MQPIYALMSSARHALDMTMYELADPEAVDILEADAARGVIVRVILDEDYSGASVNAAAYSELRSHGVQVHWAPAGTIFHQKTITVDHRTSAIMTLNLTSQYYSSTRDFAVITTDVADVAAIEQVFGTDWSNSGAPQTGPPGTNLVWSPGAEAPILALIGSAQHSLLVENEEMDDPDVTTALEVAARRGVHVEVVMTYSSSYATELHDLVAAGVKVSTYSSGASLYIHAKVIVADDRTAFVGSQNFSASSLDYNRELGIVTTDPSLVGPIARTVGSDFGGATPLSSGSSPGALGSGPPTTAPSTAGASCQASASPANDGYKGDYNVYVHSNQPDQKATASDAGDTYSYDTDGSGYAVIYLWDTSPGEVISVTVGEATCSTTA
jgi:phosphatidylserine/phosphatidylglycerophosphate/cardiolipin synthase-like enzyme